MISIQEETLDDLLQETYNALLNHKVNYEAHKGVVSYEILGASLCLKNPRSRLSSSYNKKMIFSGLGELFWYFTGDNKLDFISHYIKRYEKYSDTNELGEKYIHGGYGPRIFGNEHLSLIISKLKKKPTTRKAVIQLFENDDLLEEYEDIPCTLTLHFIIRNNKLFLFVNMRSNDAFRGLPHDIFCFTMLQEMVSSILGVELGEYYHYVSSLHIYKKDLAKVISYQNEGYFIKEQMKELPPNFELSTLDKLINAEDKIRDGGHETVLKYQSEFDEYWFDILLLLSIFNCWKKGEIQEAKMLNMNMRSKAFRTYVDEKLKDV
ncbi:thymidylate synthase [Jiulongibacter sediminis]|uniref:thymidylate synthase n=1 Tax=Jiulongibacter sediminis TaxID=1605367 RepID=A0A0P7C2M4_9BACT|nr:thymidylate synthase [Jiulongibacter sediminis]KPM48331.1 hypothetical protein AFM12_06680 [Jiulongibacter sediminis]TBX24868.1 hypothetical protein TK44_06685 [Jiulongibacter sediminis]